MGCRGHRKGRRELQGLISRVLQAHRSSFGERGVRDRAGGLQRSVEARRDALLIAFEPRQARQAEAFMTRDHATPRRV